MSGVWDTAEMLLAIAGEDDADAAALVARAMAADCRTGGRVREAEFWSQVAEAALILANPQPLIAPAMPPSAEVHPLRRAAGARGEREPSDKQRAFAARLPLERKRMLTLKRKLRAILEGRAREDEPPERKR